uniref:FZ domain-containing protein n=1 Tax=Laticauda laticaudata TaxID=8630 RepID=A0A8C5RTW9_LATLA
MLWRGGWPLGSPNQPTNLAALLSLPSRFQMAALLLLLALWAGCGLSSSSFPHHLVQLSSRRSACKPVPSSMSLCHGVGYSEMRLPNLLGHDTMKEALQQAASWVPLLTKQCHRETKKFLCSLFAPSPLPGPGTPCSKQALLGRDSFRRINAPCVATPLPGRGGEGFKDGESSVFNRN